MGTVAIATAISLSVCIPAASDSPSDAEVSGTTIQRSAELNVATGNVQSLDGESFAGATVELRRWPRAGEFDASSSGDFTPDVVAAVMSDTGGGYSLPGIDELGFTRGDLEAGVPLELVAYGHNSVSSLFVTAHINSPGQGAVIEASIPDGDNVRIRNADAGQAKTNRDSETGLKIGFVLEEGPSTVEPSASPRGLGAPSNCTKVSDLGSRSVTLLKTHSVVSGGHERSVVYKASGTTTLGVATSATGKSGTFKASGTTSVKASSSVSYGKQTNKGSATYKTSYRYGKFSCRYGTASQILSYNVYPTEYMGGGTVSTGSDTLSISSSNCAPISKGVTATKTQGKTSKFSSGVSLSSAIGINLSAESTYSTSLSVAVKATNTGRSWCGQNAGPLTSTGAIQVR